MSAQATFTILSKVVTQLASDCNKVMGMVLCIFLPCQPYNPFHMYSRGSQPSGLFYVQWAELLLSIRECWYFQMRLTKSNCIPDIKPAISKD